MSYPKKMTSTDVNRRPIEPIFKGGDSVLDGKDNEVWIERTLEAVKFVKWDRFIDLRWSNERKIVIYGWIDRHDAYKDFVVFEFDIKRQEMRFISTSSSERSKEIADAIGSGHTACQRVENSFHVRNSIKLVKG